MSLKGNPSWRRWVMKRAKPDSECQSCRGTGYVAGAQPIKTGPYVLEPPPYRVCGGTGRTPDERVS